ncbi:MAG: Stealth CR1 domain-containing protein [Cellvibrio sp.]|uniref:Stealth CR1 domain-containing protein n=1 Tax=Cellvibrio sp. TaxID=1965322 RepID=UPI00271FEF03|nr:Stealth CR1 domain-containing protein [Cellvibrio sp.]
MTDSAIQNSPIDAVITWVDGADPAHKEKLENYILSIGGQRPRAAGAARFHSLNEIEYCVVSLLKFAPWIGTIYVVSDDQAPGFIKKLAGTKYESRVKVIDHRTIFAGYEDCLPSFSSMSIASLLWRIPDLAERFIFLNDDFSLIRPLSPDAFYRDGKVVLRGSWKAQTERRVIKKIVRWFKGCFGLEEKDNSNSRVRFIGVQENSARMFGYTQNVFQLEHNPHPWLKSVWRDYCERNPDSLRANISFRLRSASQFVPEGLSAHCLLKMEMAIVDNQLRTLQIKPGDQALIRIRAKLAQAERDESYVFACFQSLENAPPEALTLILGWLDRRIGDLDHFLEHETDSCR